MPLRSYAAGCFDCHGTDTHWTGANAKAVAARHHHAAGHRTWYEERIVFESSASDPRQTDIEDAIASASSGGEPEAAPLTDPVPAAPPTSRTHPKADPIGTPRFMQRGAHGRKPEIHAS